MEDPEMGEVVETAGDRPGEVVDKESPDLGCTRDC